jgi:hypothetical protein
MVGYSPLEQGLFNETVIIYDNNFSGYVQYSSHVESRIGLIPSYGSVEFGLFLPRGVAV